ncbi:CD209 antigen-like protein C isoform X1 [Anolis carolinensis]|uniref:CD209 antigen-like protein C isoform X1 n=1 Tax=Anolis carolinensis TaxID=28377 RepID=UPI000203AFFA
MPPKSSPSKVRISPSATKDPPPPDKPKQSCKERCNACNPCKNVSPSVLWGLLVVFAIISTVILILMIYLYVMLEDEKSHPLEEPMQKLRNTMATGLRSPKLNYENPSKVADEVMKLPYHVEEAEKLYMERKKKYQLLFKKGLTSSGRWQLFGRNLYYISKGRKTWYDAENFCVSRHAHLASILSEEEQNYINSQLNRSTWIGLSDEEEEGVWEWTDGSSLTIQYWSSSHAIISRISGSEEKDCTSMEPSHSRSSWQEANCHDLKQWVCKESLRVEGL